MAPTFGSEDLDGNPSKPFTGYQTAAIDFLWTRFMPLKNGGSVMNLGGLM